MNYKQFKEKVSKEVNDFPFIFAFTNEQLEEGKKKQNVKEDKELVSLGSGIFMKKTNIPDYEEMTRRHNQDLKDLIKQDTTGENFVKSMFEYELINHEYFYTFELEDTLEALGITREELENTSNLKNGLNLAIDELKRKED